MRFLLPGAESEGNVVHDTDSEVVLRHRHSQILVNGEDLSRSSILGTQTITAAYDNRSILCTVEAVFYVEVQRFAVSTRFFRTVQYGNLLGSLGNGGKEVLGRERTIQVNGNQTYLFAIGNEVSIASRAASVTEPMAMITRSASSAP